MTDGYSGGHGPTIQSTPDDMREMIKKLYLICVESSNELARHKILRRIDEKTVEGIESKFMQRDGFFMKWSNFYDITRMTFDDSEIEVEKNGAKIKTERGKLLDSIDKWREKIEDNKIDLQMINEGLSLFRQYASILKTKGVLKVI